MRTEVLEAWARDVCAKYSPMHIAIFIEQLKAIVSRASRPPR